MKGWLLVVGLLVVGLLVVGLLVVGLLVVGLLVVGLLVVGLLDCGSILFGEELLIWAPVFLFAPQSSRTFHEIRRTSHQFNFIFNFNSSFLSIFNDLPAPMIDFPCPYPNCDHTFKRQANL